ncbi:hypothetical protein K450DRAFT_251416 [Umbelopsis ramanniana AG]|uniref:Metal homeostatis protein bsd2 n=1 Tax=Umbelopsis ramanniana AG TaxID=1314678 RepID=A0AAD5E4W8_UMBRA|nr:uncharacterized protein K450DRAFT_251416 [Umbelopsis ramanniana AG]KAI8577558.1 hypothetical protein K450DRAFT_251416 [Umbelopsis ramanniana AG]
MSRYQKVPSSEDPLESDVQLSTLHPQFNNHPSSSSLENTNSSPILRAQNAALLDSFEEITEEEMESESHGLLSNNGHGQDAIPLSSRTSSSSRRPHHNINNQHPATLPVTNDGVFANMSAKPESESNKDDETPPTYEEASTDATPPYWQTTIIAPAGMGDMVLVEGMPVGNVFAFAWNMIISMSFQFVGFMLCYLLHTSHAAKHGARAGLGISLVQYGFYISSHGNFGEEFKNEDDDTPTDEEEARNTNIVAYILMMIGWFIIIRSLADYGRAKKMEKIISAEPTIESVV